jgi:hypothetical protein
MGTLICEKHASRSFERDLQQRRRYTRVYLVNAAETSTENDVSGTSGVPQIGDIYLYDFQAQCSRKNATYVDGNVWEVEVEFSTPDPGNGGPDQQDPNPLNRPAEIDWGDNRITVVSEKDHNGDAYVNSAGDPFQNPPQTELFLPTLTHTRNEATFSAADQWFYLGTVNLDNFMGVGEGYARCVGYRGRRQYLAGFGYYWQVTRVFEFNENQWSPMKILDKGYRYLLDGSKKLASTNGVFHDKEILLDGSGGKLADDVDPVFLEFQPFWGAMFGPLNIS